MRKFLVKIWRYIFPNKVKFSTFEKKVKKIAGDRYYSINVRKCPFYSYEFSAYIDGLNHTKNYLNVKGVIEELKEMDNPDEKSEINEVIL